MIINSQIENIIFDVKHTIKIDDIEVMYYCQYLVLKGGNWHLSSYHKINNVKLTTSQKRRVKYFLNNYEIDLHNSDSGDYCKIHSESIVLDNILTTEEQKIINSYC